MQSDNRLKNDRSLKSTQREMLEKEINQGRKICNHISSSEFATEPETPGKNENKKVTREIT